MRIVAGTLGGRVLAAPPGRATRPTSERVREAVFSILGPPPPNTQVLDLFAGSGALAIEALSRGAAAATLVECARPALATLRANLRELALADRAQVIAGDVLAFLRGEHRGAPYGWVFLDPPYASALGAETLALLGATPGRLAPGAIAMIEHDRRHPPPDTAGDLLRTDQRRYGDTLVSFYRRDAQPLQAGPKP